MKWKFVLTVTALLALGAMGITTAAASAAERLWQNKGATILQAEGANITLQNVGEPEFNAGAGTLVVKCKTSYVGATITKNTAAEDKANVQALSFSQCKDGAGNEVEVQTKTEPAWLLEWVAAKAFRLTGIKAIIKDPTVGAPNCKVENAVAAFDFTSAIAPAAFEPAAAAQPLKLEAANCLTLTTATETATYKVVAAPGAENNVFLK